MCIIDPQVSYLSLSGGDDVGSTTRTVFQKLLTDEVQKEFSWEGMKKKKRLNELRIIIRAIFGE